MAIHVQDEHRNEQDQDLEQGSTALLQEDRAVPPSPPEEPAPQPWKEPWSLGRIAGVLVGVIFLAVGLAFAFLPYSRSLVGSLDGSRAVEQATCAAPVQAAFDSGSTELNADRTWVGTPPCQRSATARLGLGALFAVSGGAAIVVSARRPTID